LLSRSHGLRGNVKGKKMNKIVYIFGAGASKNALPIINEIPDRIQKLFKKLETKEFELSDNESFDLKLEKPRSKRFYQLELIDSLKWLYKQRVNYASVDTFAKKLYITDNEENLNKLKIALSVFFICEQCINKPDKRYETFFASLLNRNLEFPKNMRILTWNYDYQFELTFSGYSEKNNLSSFLHQLHIITKYAKEYNYKDDHCNIFKINGTTGLYSNNDCEPYSFTDNLDRTFDKQFIEQIVRAFTNATYSKFIYPGLSFAWEEENYSNIINLAVKDLEDTEILVVIGYSFPFFNREIDRKIIGDMKKLKKVYFQAPEQDVEALKERFQSIRDDIDDKLLVTKKDIDQFFIPNEL